jgi:hypothetical protein
MRLAGLVDGRRGQTSRVLAAAYLTLGLIQLGMWLVTDLPGADRTSLRSNSSIDEAGKGLEPATPSLES